MKKFFLAVIILITTLFPSNTKKHLRNYSWLLSSTLFTPISTLYKVEIKENQDPKMVLKEDFKNSIEYITSIHPIIKFLTSKKGIAESIAILSSNNKVIYKSDEIEINGIESLSNSLIDISIIENKNKYTLIIPIVIDKAKRNIGKIIINTKKIKY